MGEWTRKTWGDVITLQRGFDITKKVQSTGGCIPVVSSGGISSFHDEAMDAGPGVIIGRKGTLGRVHYVDGPFWPHDTTLWVKDFKGNNPRFVSYALRTLDPSFMNVGSASPTLNRNHIHPLSVMWPAQRSEQDLIAGVLKFLDDKIAANRRVQESARALMKAMVHRVQARVALSELCDQSTNSVKPSEFDETVAHFSLPAFDVGVGPEVTGSAAIKSNKFLLTAPCVLFSKLNPRIPRIWNVCSIPDEMALASTEFVVLSPSTVSSSALWATATQPDVSASLQQMVAGTSGSHQRILPSTLLSVQVRDVRLLRQGELRALEDLGELCHAYGLETRCVEQTRDTLLPLLMSGKISVTTAESLVEEVV